VFQIGGVPMEKRMRPIGRVMRKHYSNKGKFLMRIHENFARRTASAISAGEDTLSRAILAFPRLASMSNAGSCLPM